MSGKKSTNNKRKHSTSTSSSNNEEEDEMFVDAPASKHSTPSPRKVVKRDSSDSDDSDDDAIELKKGTLMSPKEAMKHLNKIKEKQGNKDPSMKHAIAAYCSELKGVDSKELQVALTKYLHLAIQPTKLALSTGSAMMTDFFNSALALKFVPGFPPKPKNALFCYTALNGMSNGLGMLKEAADAMKTDKKGADKAKKAADKEKEKYVENLQAFLENHEDELSEVQKKNVQATYHRMDKAMHPEKYPPKEKKVPASGKKRKQPKSAFEHFLALSSSLYTELEPEKRMKKLQKKFDKLDESVREVYEKLALQD